VGINIILCQREANPNVADLDGLGHRDEVKNEGSGCYGMHWWWRRRRRMVVAAEEA
jgi:hypothetical protein